VPELLAAGHEVRCMARSPERLRDLPWRERTEIVKADAAESSQVMAALENIDVAYYLIHAMGGSHHFADSDRQAAETFAAAAERSGVRRIVYLGGLTPRELLSPHLRSRAEVGEVFLRGEIPAVVVRAAVIIGSGSASFEMLRYLTERLPVMTTPRWVVSRTQPIAVRDVLRYLTAWASVPGEVNRAFDIGGPDVLTYADMMREYAAVAGLPSRVIIPVRAHPRDCRACGSAWSPRCPRASRARWWSHCATTPSAPSTTSPPTCPTPAG
jgi:uncharacterized protein YbjT (DUF2867 family)